MNHRLSIIIALLCCGAAASAQDKAEAAAIIKNINAHYASLSQWETTVRYTLYRDHVGEEIIQSDSATMVNIDGCSYFKMNDIETVSDGKYDLMIHREDKVLVLSDYNPRLANPLSRISLDTILSVCNGFQISSYGNVDCLYLGFGGSEAAGISVCYLKKDFSLFALTIYYRDERSVEIGEEKVIVKPRMEIRYLKTSPNPSINSQKCRSSWYLKPSGKEFIPTDRFKSYRIINQIISQ